MIKEWRADLQNITEVNRRLKKAVLLINIGTPDILNANITSNTTDAQLETITTEVIGNISDKIKVWSMFYTRWIYNELVSACELIKCYTCGFWQVLYDLGARKFVFQTPPPLGFLPYVKQTRNDSIISVKLNIVALLVVDELYAALMEIKQLNPAFNFTIFGDFFPIFWRVLLPPLFGKYICVNKISKYILEFVVSNSWFIY